MQDKKPTRLHLGPVTGDPTVDDEETLLAILAASQNVWLSAEDHTEMRDIRHNMRECDYSELGGMCVRAFEVLRRYLPEFTEFINTLDEHGLLVAVLPDERALHKAEHEDGILERGSNIIPYSSNKKAKFHLAQFRDGRGVTHRALYKKIRNGNKAKDWELVWAHTIEKEN